MKQISEKVIDLALSMGANECEVIMGRGRSLSLKANDGKLEEHKVSGSQIVGVRLKQAGHIGTSYSESLDESSLRLMVKTALEAAKYSKPNEDESICVNDPSPKSDFTNEKTYRDDDSSMEDKIAATLKLEADVLARGKEYKSAPYNNVSESESEKWIYNHLGNAKSIKRKYYSAYTSALVEKDGLQSMHYHGVSGLRFQDLKLSDCVDLSCRHASDLLTGKPLKTGKYAVIFEQDELSSLWGVFLRIFSAKAAIDKVNPMANRLGEQIANSEITLIDHPTYEDGLGFSPFDDEGGLSKPVELIKDGVLANFLHNSATAKKMGVTNNHRAARSSRSSLGVSTTQLVFDNGKNNEKSLRNGEYLHIISMQGLHSGANDVSGEFSFGASGYLMREGQVIAPVRNITVSGNFYDSINNVLLGDQRHSDTSAQFFAPLMRFENLSVAGE